MLIFSQRLRQLRKESGLTQVELAQKLNLTQQSYTRYEYGTGEPSLETLVRLAEIFEVSTDYLLGITDC